MSGPTETSPARTEAFSDGVFAVAITLLVLDLKVPSPYTLVSGKLGLALLKQWPSILAFGMSFFYVLIGWINHHRIFALFRRVDGAFLLLNGYLLLAFVLNPFSASLLAAYIQRPEAPVATLVYSGTNLATAIGFQIVWRYAIKDHRLIHPGVPHSVTQAISKQYNTSFPAFVLSFALAYFVPLASVAISLAVILFYTITGFTFPELDPETGKLRRERSKR
jgi:uncharacterized membrane protein